MDRSNLPVVPAAVLNKYQISVPTDDRFRAVARLLQAIWLERQGFSAGDRVSRDGVISPLGSRSRRRILKSFRRWITRANAVHRSPRSSGRETYMQPVRLLHWKALRSVSAT